MSYLDETGLARATTNLKVYIDTQISQIGGNVNEYDLIISKGGYGLLDDFISYLILNGGYN